jgi:hypothetical protein
MKSHAHPLKKGAIMTRNHQTMPTICPRHSLHWILSLTLLLGALPFAAIAQETARGTVFHDTNGNGVRDANERGIAGVAVSNGRDVVRTSGDGRYELPVSNETIIFLNKPAGYMPPVDEQQVPRFYYVHRPGGTAHLRYGGVPPTGSLPESIDIPLHEQADPTRFWTLFFGDTQPRNQQEIDYIAHDVIEPLVGFDAQFGVVLGDILFDNLSYFGDLADALKHVGVPMYYVPGNHDMDFDSPDNTHAMETFINHFGPPYHAYQFGEVHFLVLNNIHWEGDGYHGRFGEDQLEFLRNYLADVPKEHLIVPMMHIPLNGVRDLEAFFEILGEFPNTFSVSAHWHRQTNIFMGQDQGWPREEPHHHLVNVTVCGSWWCGALDETGIPHATMSDGAPNGYSIITFDGPEYSVEYRAARRPADYQMLIHTPEATPVGQTASTEVVVNVFAGSERSTVEMRLAPDGPWTALERTVRHDPYYLQAKANEQWISDRYIEPMTDTGDADFDLNRVEGILDHYGRRLPAPRDSSHIWVGHLPADVAPGSHLLDVRTTDMYGQTYTAHRIFRVVEE